MLSSDQLQGDDKCKCEVNMSRISIANFNTPPGTLLEDAYNQCQLDKKGFGEFYNQNPVYAR